MGRLLLALVLLALSFAIVKYLRVKLDEHRSADRLSKKQAEELDYGKVVKCAVCGVHVPQHEAIIRGEKTFCSLRHMNQNNP